MKTLSFPKLVLAAVLILVSLPFLVAYASNGYDPPITATSIEKIIDVLLKFAVAVITPLAALAVMIAAFLYVTSGGDAARLGQAKQAITYAVIGLVIALSAEFLKDVVMGIAEGATAAESFADFLDKVVRAFGQVLMGISVLAILYSAFLFLTAGDDQLKVSQARRIITYAVFGLILAILAFAIPGVIKNFLK